MRRRAECSLVSARPAGAGRLLAAATVVTFLVVPGAMAQSASTGKTLYASYCTNCHAPNPAQDRYKAQLGADKPSVIQSAIARNVGSMGFLTWVTTAQLADIAAYIANPSAATTPATATATVGANSLNFCGATVGVQSAAASTTLTNSGTGSLSISGITSSSSVFHAATATTCVTGGTVAAGASCLLAYYAIPSASGTSSGTVTVTSNATNSPTTLALSASTSACVPVLAWPSGTTGVSFSSVAVGSSATRTLTLTNEGAASATLSAVNLSGIAAAAYTKSGTCTTTNAVGAGERCDLTLHFTPTATGNQSATLNVTANATGPGALTLSGTGLASGTGALTASPASVAFGTVTVGTTATVQSITLTNSGTANLQVTNLAASSPFALGTLSSEHCGTVPFTLLVGQSCATRVVYSPNATGAATGSLTISLGAGNTTTVALSGTGGSVVSNVGGGGCSMASPGAPLGGPVDLSLAVLALLAVTGAWRRRGAR